MKSVARLSTITASTTSTPTNQSLRQKLPRFADDDVLTYPPLVELPDAVESHSHTLPQRRQQGAGLRLATLADGHVTDKGLCHLPPTNCCKSTPTGSGGGLRLLACL